MERSDFDGMKINPFEGLDSGQPLHKCYPRLAGVSVLTDRPSMQFLRPDGKRFFVELPEIDMLARFALLFAAKPGNPLALNSDWDSRKDEAFRLLNINTAKWANVAWMIESDNPIYLDLVKFWLQMLCREDYTIWFTYKVQFHGMAAFLRTPMSQMDERMSGNVLKTMQAMEELSGKIKNIESVLFPDETTATTLAEQETVYLWAEKNAAPSEAFANEKVL